MVVTSLRKSGWRESSFGVGGGARKWPDRERAGDFDQPFVDMRERIRRPIERTFVTDKGEQAFSDLGIVAALCVPARKCGASRLPPQRDHDQENKPFSFSKRLLQAALAHRESRSTG